MKLILLGILIDEVIRGVRKIIIDRDDLAFENRKLREELERKKTTPVYVQFDYDKKS